MTDRRVLVASALFVGIIASFAQVGHLRADDERDGRFFIEKNGRSIEPRAGRWRTWVISSGKDYRVPPPPGPAETRGELRNLANLIRQNDATTRDRIAFWDAGAPGYRWLDLVSTRVLAGQTVSAYPHRVYTYLALAMYDATIATWESKYHYRRPRPSDVDPRIPTALDVPDSPSYPSEHAAAAQAAASVLAYFFPSRGGQLPEDGRRGGMVARARRRAVSERLLRRAHARPARRRAGDRESKG